MVIRGKNSDTGMSAVIEPCGRGFWWEVRRKDLSRLSSGSTLTLMSAKKDIENFHYGKWRWRECFQ